MLIILELKVWSSEIL